MKIVYLKPKSSFLGEQMHSDTLFGAICWGIRQIYGNDELEEMLCRFDRDSEKFDPPFLISSSFPYMESEKGKMHFLPKPILKPIWRGIKTKESLDKLKAIKKVAYLQENLFNDWINGKLTDSELFENIELKEDKVTYKLDGEEYLQKNGILIENGYAASIFIGNEKGHATKILKGADIQRNVINRLSNTTTEGGLFYTHETFIGKKSGLYFLIEIKDRGYENLLNASLRFIEDRGISGDVSVGKGQFDIELLTEAEIIHEPKNPDSFTNLSLYYPCDDEIQFFKQHEEKTWYNLIGRKGKIESAFVSTKDIWKESIQMFEEGSTFPLIADRELYGKNPIVKEKPFKIQHYGFALPVKMRMVKNEI